MIATSREVRYARSFLAYLREHFNKAIDANDRYLVLAVIAWMHQEAGGLSKVKGNNPFNIRSSPLAIGKRKTDGNGSFAVFATMAKGFEAAALLLMTGGWGSNVSDIDAYGYRAALRALTRGGNEGAVDFLVGLAMSSWDVGRYGTVGHDPRDPAYNRLLTVYGSFTGIKWPQKPKPSTGAPAAQLGNMPRDFDTPLITRDYGDPWEAKRFFEERHRKTGRP